MPDIKSIIINTPTEALEDVLSPFIEEQFPSFMRSDYRKLVLFIKAYYEWMEQAGNVGFASRKLDSVIDIDNNLNEFYEHFKSTYMNGFPEALAITTDVDTPNKKTLLKKIKNFYGSKGTESAYRFLFRILYDSDVQFNYPKNQILKASDGQWIEEISIKVTRKNESYHDSLAGGRVYQFTDANTIAASADIERVQKYYQNGIPVTELYLVNLVGTFSPNVSVTLDNPSFPEINAFTEQTYGVLGDFYVETQGENYIIGDVVYISSNGVGFTAKVSQTGLGGSVKRIAIENSGINYYDTLTGIVLSSNGSNNTARITLQATAVTRYPGYYSGNTGKISSTQKLYDGDEYQDYSYKLKSAVSIDRYYSVLRELVHPAGMKMFGSVLLEDAAPSTMSGSTQVTRIGGTSRVVIGAYMPYTFGTTLDLRNNGVTLSGSWIINDGGISYGTTGDLYPVGYNPYISGTADTGPAGLTTSPLGTTFNRGGSGGFLGYTYCSVPEGGRTAHNPLGGALGGVTAWRGNKESVLEPDMVGFSPLQLVGLTLWLKPENIGVCGGSMITGRSMDIWRDASASQNHALPPKWDGWTSGPQYAGVTIDKLRPTLVVADRGIPGRTGIQFNGGVVYGPHTVWTQAGVCGGYGIGKTLGGLPATGMSFGSGRAGEKIQSGQHFNLTRGITLTKDMSIFIAFRAGSTAAGYTQSNYGLGLVSSSKKFLEFSSPTLKYTLPASNLLTNQDISNASVYVPISAGTASVPVVGGLTYSPNGDSLSARTISFNTGVGTAASDYSLISIPLPQAAQGSTYTTSVWLKGNVGGEVILIRGVAVSSHTPVTLTTSWQRFTTTEIATSGTPSFQIGLRQAQSGTINAAATISMWGAQLQFGSDVSGYGSYGSETDHLLYHRSYNDIDADAAKQTSVYYPVRSTDYQSLYPYESGLVGLRNNVGSTTSSRIAYNPSLSTLNGISTDDITIGEWNRQKDNRIRSFYSGLESRNYSANTSRRIATTTSPGGVTLGNNPAAEVSYNTNSFNIGRFGAYCLPVLDAPYSDSTASSSFVASALLNPSYSFNGVIYEVIIYDRVLAETERQAVYSYLSRKYKAETIMPSVYVSSHPSAFGVTSGYWNISKHPNAAGSSKILAGASMGAISIEDFSAIYGYVYKSAGTRLADGSVLTTDTYIALGK
jgi:hypothetical protein